MCANGHTVDTDRICLRTTEQKMMNGITMFHTQLTLKWY